MCTIVVRCSPGNPVLLLAVRDELVGRGFDDPGAWWPEHPHMIGGRDRHAGGTWCATDVSSGTTALVLNGNEQRVGDPGSTSRGALPLLVLEHGSDWPREVELLGMASFVVVLVRHADAVLWTFDGVQLTTSTLHAGTHMLTAGPREDRRTERHLSAFTTAASPEAWRALVTEAVPSGSPDALLVNYPHEGATFATVFAQIIQAAPGRLTVDHSRRPTDGNTWSRKSWTSSSAVIAALP